MKYGHPELLDRESLFRFFFWMKHTPPAESGAFMSHAEGSEVAWRQSVARAREYLNHVVQEIRWADRLNPFNHCPHFPFFMTHFTDSMPISSIGGIWSADLWNPKYASHVYKVTVAVDMLGNIVWICPLAPGTSADVLIWDGLLVPEGISLILKLGAMMALIKAGFMSLCHSLEERMAL